ncbi:hypothetical protein EIP91_003624 [Steccherinum ochraceum]|uniref:Uncharacterized protein n=1 Tax=Steccherinum ochraceum TaxID=92696 RepID=A0A4V2MW39_9APHY|nr:hypothetical protein EIP91_003624 [Steccherinum ochraceum]
MLFSATNRESGIDIHDCWHRPSSTCIPISSSPSTTNLQPDIPSNPNHTFDEHDKSAYNKNGSPNLMVIPVQSKPTPSSSREVPSGFRLTRSANAMALNRERRGRPDSGRGTSILDLRGATPGHSGLPATHLPSLPKAATDQMGIGEGHVSAFLGRAQEAGLDRGAHDYEV